ncbi:HpcH/HpaI aldolase/citrate lyase family protein [Halobacterium sp. KA-6]|uniref:HpcH/HpaI aldolase/citrate lyase family protein n=1 Tax=Halobacterium sp. KA-6 TaxID=2896368 RepID=UPI001E3D4569|nr:CoA ester lyase [Halobacterium sp. KA-6]MCD2202222.1 CoA ester lyase [Halobacterium sp. KA-6]
MARRSVLFSPGDQPELLRKAPETGADVVVFDLEDAVVPARKTEARTAVQSVLADPGFDPDCEVCVRVNPIGAGARDDVETVLAGESPRLDAVVLPKARSADEVTTLGRLLDERAFDVPVLALVESARGVLRAEEIADAGPTDALVFGAEDLAADVGATRTDDGVEVLHAREQVVLAAGAAGVDAIDTVYTDIEDTEGLAEETEFAAQLGYDGKLAIHPSQVDPINDAFTPADEDVEWAKRVLDAKEEADEAGHGVYRVDGEMVDAPLVAQAERILERALAAGIENGN